MVNIKVTYISFEETIKVNRKTSVSYCLGGAREINFDT